MPENSAKLRTAMGTSAVTLNNASDYRANGLLTDYIGWTNGITDYQIIGLTH